MSSEIDGSGQPSPGDEADPVTGDVSTVCSDKAFSFKGSDPEEREVYKLLGPEVIGCLLDKVDRGDVGLQQVEDLAGSLHSKAKGNLKRKKECPNFKYDRMTLREVLCDWYREDWPEGSNNESGVTLEKLKEALKDVQLFLEKSSTGVWSLKGVVHDEEKTIENIGSEGWDALLDAFGQGLFPLQRAEIFAIKLNQYTGGWFKNLKSLPNFEYSEQVFKKILMDWAARAEIENGPVSLAVIQDAVSDEFKLEEQTGGEMRFKVKEVSKVEASSAASEAEKEKAEVQRENEDEASFGAGLVSIVVGSFCITVVLLLLGAFPQIQGPIEVGMSVPADRSKDGTPAPRIDSSPVASDEVPPGFLKDDLTGNGHKKILIIGKTGTGKSSVSNVLCGLEHNAKVFPVSSGTAACTQKTYFADAFFNNNKERPVSVIDTMGFDDPNKNHDAEIIAELVHKLHKGCDYVHLFVIAVNGQNPRLDGSLVAMIKIFEGMFGEDFWNQVVVLFTRMPMDRKSKSRRNKGGEGQTDDQLAEQYMKDVAQKFNRRGKIDYVFLDVLYDAEDPEEKEHFDEALEKLHEHLDAAVGLPTSKVKEIETENSNLKRMIAEKEEAAKAEKEKREEAERTAEEERKKAEAEKKRAEAAKEEAESLQWQLLFWQLSNTMHAAVKDFGLPTSNEDMKTIKK